MSAYCCIKLDLFINNTRHVECCSKIKSIWDIVHLVGFTIEIYYDARSYMRQTINFVWWKQDLTEQRLICAKNADGPLCQPPKGIRVLSPTEEISHWRSKQWHYNKWSRKVEITNVELSVDIEAAANACLHALST